MSFDRTFVCDDEALRVANLAKEILGEGYVVIEIVSLKISENYEVGLAHFEAKVLEIADNKVRNHHIVGEGVGLLDACFDAMLKSYEVNYCSLSSISIVDFTLSAHLDSQSERKSDSQVSALLRIKNSRDYEYSFKCTTSSISHSSVCAVQEAMAFFINAELAYARLYYAWADAKERGRHDLIDRYRNQMAILVNATSYEKLVAKLKEQKKSQ